MEIEIDSKEITAQVLSYHSMEEGIEKEKEKGRILRITEELIYLEPVMNGFISEEDASGFYLEQRKNAEKLLEAYRISKLAYPDYIGSVMRVRVRNYLMHKRERENDIRRLHYEEIYHGGSRVEDIEEIYEADEKMKKLDSNAEPKACTTIREAVGRIMSSTSRTRYEDHELRVKSTRHGLVCMLLSLPKGGGYEYIDHFAEMLGVNPYLILSILKLRDEYDEEREERNMKHREVIGKHFKILLRLNTAYKLCEDEEEKNKLMELSLRLEELIDRRCERMRHENGGFTQREMGSILGISRSTVCSNLKKARMYLTSKLST